jgi:hypothetical protein
MNRKERNEKWNTKEVCWDLPEQRKGDGRENGEGRKKGSKKKLLTG